MFRKWAAGALALTLSLGVLAGCGGKKEETPAPTTPAPAANNPAPATKAFKVVMSTDVGGLNDNSFNAAAYRGLQKLKSDLSVDINAIESKKQEDYEPNLNLLSDQKADLIWAIGFMMAESLDKVAKQLPNQKFAIIDSEVKDPNVASVTFKEEEGSFLMGVIAAKATKSKKVGFVGGMEVDVIKKFEAGYKAGVKSVDPSIQVITVYSGSFGDPVKGKADALTILGQGADVIFHASGGTGNGVIEACKEKGKFAIGVDSDQKSLAPDNVISSMMKRVDVAVFDISKMAKDGTFPGGKTTVLGLKESGVGYSDTTAWEKMPQDTKALVDKWADAIKSGKVTVPADLKALEAWKVPTL